MAVLSLKLALIASPGNAARDRVHQHALRKLGWRSIVVWECQTEKPKPLQKLSLQLARILS